MEQHTFSITEALQFGWRLFKQYIGLLVGASLFVIAVSAAFGWLSEDGNGLAELLISLVGTLVQWWLYVGLISIGLMLHNGDRPQFSDLFNDNWRMFGNYVVGTVLYSLIALAGFILLIVPGVIWSIKYHYYAYLIVEKNMKPIEALKESGRITMGNKWKILGFFFVIGLMNFVGVLALGIGLLVTLPVTLIASVYVYKQLSCTPAAVVADPTPAVETSATQTPELNSEKKPVE